MKSLFIIIFCLLLLTGCASTKKHERIIAALIKARNNHGITWEQYTTYITIENERYNKKTSLILEP